MTNNLFDALGLKKSVIKAIRNLGYSAPTPVQAEFIPVVLQGRDALASAKTGSGKTAAYAIPVLNFLLDYDSKTALFVAPTRELAQQIQSVFRDLAKDTDINTALITGGKKWDEGDNHKVGYKNYYQRKAEEERQTEKDKENNSSDSSDS